MDQQRTILVIEDDEAVLYYIQVVLERQGYSVVTAQDAQTGMNLLTQHHPALIICDYHMPGTNGLTVLERIRALEVNDERIPFIMISVDTGPSIRKQCHDKGGDVFLEKPFAPEQLWQAVTTLIDEK